MLDKITAKAKQVLGRLSGDDDLSEEGQLQEQKTRAADDAARLATEAEQAEEAAAIAAAEEANRLELERVQAQQDEIARQAQIDRERLASEAEVAAEHTEALEEASKLEKEAVRARETAEALKGAQTNLEQLGGQS